MNVESETLVLSWKVQTSRYVFKCAQEQPADSSRIRHDFLQRKFSSCGGVLVLHTLKTCQNLIQNVDNYNYGSHDIFLLARKYRGKTYGIRSA